LQYNNKNYSAAADAMGVAVKLQPDYANARYFLGLAYARIGKTADAIDQFDELQKSNPNNEEINLILANLRAGKPIFADAVAPVTPNPEKRSNLPIKENK
jgi:tetratricopeptide (TPR) repeat protein